MCLCPWVYIFHVTDFLVVLGLLSGIWTVAWRITKKVKKENQ